jgi:hypothetical protein
LDLAEVSDSIANKCVVNLVEGNGPLLEGRRSYGADVVGSAALVVEGHLSVSLEVADLEGSKALVDRELLVISADSVSVSIGVGEESRLEDRVGGWLYTWHQMGRVEGSLLNFCEVVGRVSVKGHLAEFSERVVLVWPDLGQIEDIDLGLFSLLGSHGWRGGTISVWKLAPEGVNDRAYSEHMFSTWGSHPCR